MTPRSGPRAAACTPAQARDRLSRFTRLLALKSNAHYSAGTISAQQAEQSLRTARDMIIEADAMTG